MVDGGVAGRGRWPFGGGGIDPLGEADLCRFRRISGVGKLGGSG